MGEVSRRMNADDLEFAQAQQRISALQLAALIMRIHDNTINNNSAKAVFDALWNENKVAIATNEPLHVVS